MICDSVMATFINTSIGTFPASPRNFICKKSYHFFHSAKNMALKTKMFIIIRVPYFLHYGKSDTIFCKKKFEATLEKYPGDTGKVFSIPLFA